MPKKKEEKVEKGQFETNDISVVSYFKVVHHIPIDDYEIRERGIAHFKMGGDKAIEEMEKLADEFLLGKEFFMSPKRFFEEYRSSLKLVKPKSDNKLDK